MISLSFIRPPREASRYTVRSAALGTAIICCAAMLVLSGCASNDAEVRKCLNLQQDGDIEGAWQGFRALADQHPDNEDYVNYERSAREMAFRQAVKEGQMALGRNDLAGFVAAMQHAESIRLSPRVAAILAMIQQAKDRGESDHAVLAAITDGACPPEDWRLPEALTATAEALQKKIIDGSVAEPISILEIAVLGEPAGANWETIA